MRSPYPAVGRRPAICGPGHTGEARDTAGELERHRPDRAARATGAGRSRDHRVDDEAGLRAGLGGAGLRRAIGERVHAGAGAPADAGIAGVGAGGPNAAAPPGAGPPCSMNRSIVASDQRPGTGGTAVGVICPIRPASGCSCTTLIAGGNWSAAGGDISVTLRAPIAASCRGDVASRSPTDAARLSARRAVPTRRQAGSTQRGLGTTRCRGDDARAKSPSGIPGMPRLGAQAGSRHWAGGLQALDGLGGGKPRRTDPLWSRGGFSLAGTCRAPRGRSHT